MTRIDVAPDIWTDLRVEPWRPSDVTDYLGHLVHKEVARLRRRGPRTTTTAAKEEPEVGPAWVPDWEL